MRVVEGLWPMIGWYLCVQSRLPEMTVLVKARECCAAFLWGWRLQGRRGMQEAGGRAALWRMMVR